MPFQPGQSGNPRGRAGLLSLRTQKAIELFEKFNFDPLEEKIALAKSVRGAIPKVENGERLEYRKLYAVMLSTLLKYCYPQLKATEHSGEVTHIHTTEELARMSDVELQAYVISYRAQLQEASDANA